MAATQVESYEEVRRRKLEENKRKLEELKLGHLSVALREASTPKTSSPVSQVESYEEVRRRKLEENKRKLEELKLGHLSVALREVSTPKTSSPAKQVKRKPAQEEYTIVKRRSDRLANLPEPTYVKRRSDGLANLPEPTYVKRRSDRLANLPEPIYKEVIPVVVHRPRKISKHSVRISKRRDLSNRPRKISKHSVRISKHRDLSNRPRKISKHSVRISKHRDLSNRVYASHRARAYTIKKAGELEDGLGAAYPSFVKPMLQSHTTGGFWLGLPTKFCNMHLPKHDSTIYLVDEDGEESPTTYLAYKKGLSAGWRGFSITHELVDGDALVFQLIKATTFKVYIIRASSYGSRQECSWYDLDMLEVIPEVVHRPRKISKHSVRISKHRDLSNRVYASHRARAYTIKKAGELEDGLGAAYPSFVKPMLQSHTTGGFWLGLPSKFCNMHLPKHDSTIYLVDEDGEESPTTYLAYKKGLSAGWRGFSITHELVDGDALVFQLIKATTFKVYIIRASSYANFLSVKKQKKQEDQVKKKKKNGKTKRVLTLFSTSDRELPLLCSV